MKNIQQTLRGALFAGLALAVAACQTTPPPQPEPPRVITKPEPVLIEKPKTCIVQPLANKRASFIAKVWSRNPGEHQIGQLLNLHMQAAADTYMSLYAVTTSCGTYRLLDNYQAKGGQTVDFPAADSGINVRLKPPAGTEQYILVATRTPFNWLASSDVLSEGSIAKLDMTPNDLRRRLQAATNRLDPQSWAASNLRIKIN
jgi:hypothetical protein